MDKEEKQKRIEQLKKELKRKQRKLKVQVLQILIFCMLLHSDNLSASREQFCVLLFGTENRATEDS